MLEGAHLVHTALVALALAHPPPCSAGRLVREGVAHHFERASIIDELSVSDPASGVAWTGLSLDGNELNAMPDRLSVSFKLHGELRTLDVARAKTLVSPNYDELVIEIPAGQSTLPSNLSGLLKANHNRDGGRRDRRTGPRRRRAALDCLYQGQIVALDLAGNGFVSLSACELPLKIHATVYAPDESESFEIQPLEDGGHVAYNLADLKDTSPASCGVDEDEHAEKNTHADDHWAFKGNGTGRHPRQNCAKTVTRVSCTSVRARLLLSPPPGTPFPHRK